MTTLPLIEVQEVGFAQWVVLMQQHGYIDAQKALALLTNAFAQQMQLLQSS